jgi:hypothetical protein
MYKTHLEKLSAERMGDSSGDWLLEPCKKNEEISWTFFQNQ